MITKNIVSIGLELEGGITMSHEKAVLRKFNRAESGRDNSVDVDLPTRAKYSNDAELKYWSTSFERIEQFIDKVFSDGRMFKQNGSCGNHVHFRFNDMDKAVAIFSYSSTRRKFAKAYEKFAEKMDYKYMSRMHNGYCSTSISDYKAIDQLETKDGKAHERYTAINLNSFWLYGTIEIRILPHMENAKEYLDAVKWLVATMEALYNEAVEGSLENDELKIASMILPEKKMHKYVTVPAEFSAERITDV